MGEVGEYWRDVREMKAEVQAHFGIECPMCVKEQPRRTPTRLLPGGKCRVHKPHYRDERPFKSWLDIYADLHSDAGANRANQ